MYQVIFAGGIAHFHSWLVPRREGDEKGVPFIAKDITCEQAEAEKLAEKLREMLEDTEDAHNAAKAYEEWKNDSSVARAWDEANNDLGKR